MSLPWYNSDAPISFTWDLWYSCNYRCSYCWFEMDNKWEEIAKLNKMLAPQEWVRIWNRIGAPYGGLRIDMLGGEPLYYPRIGELLEGLSRKNVLVVTTNLSPELNKLRAIISDLDPERVHFNVSFHPEFTDFDSFLERLTLLKDQKFDPGVLFVTYPPLLEKLPEYRKAFHERGFPFTLMIFQGMYKGKRYPEAFSGDKKEMIKKLTVIEAETKYRLLRSSTKGKLCHAGTVYANVKGNGDVYRCGQDAFGLKRMGNILDPDFKLHDGPQPCPYEQCSCLEFKFLDELRTA